MTASQRTKEKCGNKQNKPVKTSEAANCCCMVAPWVVIEDGRNYQLKVTKTKQERDGKTVSDKEEHSNKEDEKYELHIVAPPADTNGKVTYKKITSNHKFLNKECDLKMLAKSATEEKSISEGGSFEIDTNGNIKGAMGENCKEDKLASDIKPGDYKTLAGYVKGLEKTSDEDFAKEVAAYLKSLEAEEIEASEEKTDMELVLGSLFNPQSIANKIALVPSGSNKCDKKSTPSLYVYPYSKADGSFSFMYAKAKKTEVLGYKGQIEVSRAEIEVTGGFNLYHGTKVITIGGSQKIGGGSYVRKRKRQYGERKAGKSIFGTMETILSYFKKIEQEQNKHNISQGRSSSVVKNHTLFKFDPGRTGFSVAIKQHELKEIDDSYNIDYVSDMSLNVHLLNGVSITVDCIEYLIILASVTAPYVASLLSNARDNLDAGVGGKNLNVKAGAAIELSLSGGITSTLKWKKELSKDIKVEEGKLAGTLGFKAKAHIYGESKILFVTIKGEAGGMAASAIKATIASQVTLKASLKSKENNLLIGGGVDFTGLALYYVLNGSIKLKKDDTSKGSGSGVFDSDSTGFQSTLSKEKKWDGHLTLFEKWDDKNGEKDAYYDLEQFFD